MPPGRDVPDRLNVANILARHTDEQGGCKIEILVYTIKKGLNNRVRITPLT
jgi:hypothetical protein